MSIVYNRSQMQRADQETISRAGIPAMVLMERAALGVFDHIRKNYKHTSRILVLCGSGNNGADGVAVARLLYLEGIQAEVFFAGDETRCTDQMKQQLGIWRFLKQDCLTELPDPAGYDCLVDALFGIGLDREITGKYEMIIRWMNGTGLPVVAVDIPSGIHADTGRIMNAAVKADATITFSFCKVGQLLFPGRENCGRLIVHDAGILPLQSNEGEHRYCTLNREDALKLLPDRPSRSNKGTFGNAFLYVGSGDMAGAAVLSAKAAYRAGCGLVTVLSDPVNRPILLGAVPEIIFKTEGRFSITEEALCGFRCIAAGPGIGTEEKAWVTLSRLIEQYHGPMVLDADALNLISAALYSGDDTRKKAAEKMLCRGQLIITPHPGEMARLVNRPVRDVVDNIEETAVSFAEKYGLICVLKDASTVVTDGHHICLNTTGCSGMAAGGSGDVLTGLLSGLIAQGMPLLEAAMCSVFFHGLAGEAAQTRLGSRSMMASDLADAVSDVL